LGDGRDGADDIADPLRGLRQGDHLGIGPVCLFDGLPRNPARFDHLPADLLHGRGQFFGRIRDRAPIGRSLLRGARDADRALLRGPGRPLLGGFFCPAHRRSASIMLSLNTPTAAAIAPISSLRPVPPTSTAVSPPAGLFLQSVFVNRQKVA
jgi:hypothetical protein